MRTNWFPFSIQGSIFLLLLLFSQSGFAQLVEVPIRRIAAPTSAKPVNAAARITAQAPLTLPFFDDFSSANQRAGSNRPDTLHWIDTSGVNINNTLPLNHPTMYVATFDGLNRNGAPYNFTSDLAQGVTDILISQPIDLSLYTPGDSVYLSFYWQAPGSGEMPDLEDTLRIEFKDAAGVWRPAWKQAGQIQDPTTQQVTNLKNDSTFLQTLIPVKEAAYFHSGFQFRFAAFGRQAGAFDVWHIDYVYLDRGRTAATPYPGRPNPPEVYPKDIACRKPVSSFLKYYTAMPVWQYFYDPVGQTADTISTDINNLFNNASFTEYTIRVEDTLSKQVFQSCDTPPQVSLPPCDQASVGIAALSAQTKSFLPIALPATTPQNRMVLRSTFDFNITGEFLPDVNIGANNRISGYTILDNYFAYDDGTAEAGGGINQRQGRVAVQFIGQPGKTDTLIAIQSFLAQYNVNQAGQSFVIQVFDNKDGFPNEILHQQVLPIQYTTGLNQFQTDTLKVTKNNEIVPISIAVKDTFYIGWQQTTDNVLPIGLDKNTNSGNRIFYNLGAGQWARNSEQQTPIQGSFMIRPLMGRGLIRVPTGVEPTIPEPAVLQVYPNPTNGQITWSDATYSNVQVYDVRGKVLLTHRGKVADTPQLDLGTLANGLYLLHFSNGKQTIVRKVVVVK